MDFSNIFLQYKQPRETGTSKVLKGYPSPIFFSHGIDGMEKLSYVCPMEFIFMLHFSSHINFLFLFALRKNDWRKGNDVLKERTQNKKRD